MVTRELNIEEGNLEKLGEMINDIEIAMLTTIDERGLLRSRPMATQEMGRAGQLWFFVDSNSSKVGEIQRNNQVNIVYADPRKHRFVSVSGRGSFVHDKNKMRELWSPVYKTWFSDGLNDPRLTLLKITVERAEYWDAPTISINAFIHSIRTRSTEEFYKDGTHGRVNGSV